MSLSQKPNLEPNSIGYWIKPPSTDSYSLDSENYYEVDPYTSLYSEMDPLDTTAYFTKINPIASPKNAESYLQKALTTSYLSRVRNYH